MKRASDICVRVVFELQFRGKDRAYAIQNRISAFAANRLPGLLADGLSELTTDSWLAVDRVELDAGEVCITQMEDDLAKALVKSLWDWVSSLGPLHIAQISPSSAASSSGRKDSVWQKEGAHSQPGKKTMLSGAGSLNAAVAAALEKPADWSAFLAALRDNHALRCRLADEVSPRLLRRLVAALAPELGTWIADYAEALFTLHEHLPLLAMNIHVFRRSVWECIFCELAISRSSGSTQLNFTTNVLKRIAARHGSRVSEIAADLALSLQRQSQHTPITELLMAVVAELRAQSAGESPRTTLHSESQELSISPVPKAGITVRRDTSRRLQDLAKFLEFSVLPWNLTRRGAEEEMLGLLAAVPGEVCALLWDLIEAEPARKRLASEFSETATTRALTAIAPTAAYWMISYMRQLRRLHAQKPLFPLRNVEFAQQLWELCFQYVSQRKGQTFDSRSFLRFLMMQLAARQKSSYEILLPDLALRRGRHSLARKPKNNSQSDISLERTFLALVDEAILGPQDHPDAPRFLVKHEHQHIYSDLDVLAYWLRWRKLPKWSHATNPEDTGRRLGLLLRQMPRHVQSSGRRVSTGQTATLGDSKSNGSTIEPPAAEQVQHWLVFGLWPGAVSTPDSSQLATWLEKQTDADWLKALEAAGTSEAVAARIAHLLSPSFFERIVRLLADDVAGAALDYIRFLDRAGRHQPMATQLWSDQLRKYTLMYLLRTSSISGTPSISIFELARSTMLALALNCRVPYERLLEAMEQESHGHSETQNICRWLRQELEAGQGGISDPEQIVTVAAGPSPAASVDPVDLVLQYLKYGSLPENASDMTFSALKTIAGRLSDRQISSLANACCAEIQASERSSYRAATLFSKRDFIRLANSLQIDTNVLDELEEALSTLACRFSLTPEPLVTIARSFLLRRSGRQMDGTSSRHSMEAVLAALLPEIADFIGTTPEIIRRELDALGKNKISPETLVEQQQQQIEPKRPLLPQERKPEVLSEIHAGQAPNGEGTASTAHDLSGRGQVDSSFTDDDRYGRLAALSHFLRTGQLAWWDQNLSREPSRNWFAVPLDRSPRLLLETLRSVCDSPGALQRLTRYAAKNDLEQIVRAAVPEYAGMLLLYLSAASELSEATYEQQAVSRKRDAAAIHWREALSFVLDEHANKTSAGNALRELTVRVSRALTIAHERYVTALAMTAREKSSKTTGFNTLAEMLEQTATSTDTDKTDAGEDVQPVTKTQERPAEDSLFDDVIGSCNSNAALQHLDYLLRYGDLPEGASQKDPDKLIAQIMEESSKQPSEYRRYFLKIAGRELERKRLIRFLPVRIFPYLWPLLSPSDHASVSICFDTLGETVNVSSAGKHGKSCREIVLEEVFKSVVKSAQRWDSAAYFRSAIARLSEHLSSRPAILVKRLRSILEKKSDAVQQKLLPIIDRVELEMATMPPVSRTRKANEAQTPKSNKISRPMPKGEPFYVDNAGIVLLWPFLQLYFQKLSLLEKKGFRDEHAQFRAVYLLQYLATGTMEAPEHQLLLNKIIIGIRPEQPLEHPTPLTEGEQALSEQLLKGVLQNWQKLKNSSVAALQQSFLMREGKLLLMDDGWSLAVSAKAYDILLDSLPWSLSLVKLSWMKALLQVKWR